MTREEIASVLKNIRTDSGLTQKEAANRIGRKQQTLASWETGQSQPDANTLFVLCEIYGTTVDRAFGFNNSSNFVSANDKILLEKFNSLDKHGKRMITLTLEEEYNRCQEEKQVENKVVSIRKKQIQYYQRLASAGTGQIVFNGLPMDFIEIEDTPEYRNVKFAIGVNGDSMKPLYRDGDTLLVEPTPNIEIGQAGIFMLDGESYVKKLGNGVLESENPKYEDIPITENTYCLGSVVDCIKSDESKMEDKFLEGIKNGDDDFKRLMQNYKNEKLAESTPFRTVK